MRRDDTPDGLPDCPTPELKDAEAGPRLRRDRAEIDGVDDDYWPGGWPLF